MITALLQWGVLAACFRDVSTPVRADDHTLPSTRPADVAVDVKRLGDLLAQRPLEIKCDEVPPEDAVSFIADTLGTKTAVDWLQMEEASVTRAVFVNNLHLRDAALGATFNSAANHPLILEYTLNESGALVLYVTGFLTGRH